MNFIFSATFNADFTYNEKSLNTAVARILLLILLINLLILSKYFKLWIFHPSEHNVIIYGPVNLIIKTFFYVSKKFVDKHK